jgi:hypothetical protein
MLCRCTVLSQKQLWGSKLCPFLLRVSMASVSSTRTCFFKNGLEFKNMMTRRVRSGWLLCGDALIILVVTMVGFLTHYGAVENWRWLSTFLPVLAAWLAIAPWLGLYRSDLNSQPLQLWRPVLAALLSAPLAATLRGTWLSEPVLPLFVGVLGLTNGLGLLIWRLVWLLIMQRATHQAGVAHG